MRGSHFDCWIMRHAGTLILAIACGAIAVLSWMPGDARPDTILQSGNLEHLLAYVLLGGLTAVLKRHALSAYWLIVIVVAFAGTMELGQLFIPTRYASPANFGAGALGAVIGILLVARAMHRPTQATQDTPP
jgi:VanZ family protein